MINSCLKLSEGPDSSIATLGIIDKDKPIYLLVTLDGFYCSGRKRAATKKFKKKFRRKGHKVPPYIKFTKIDKTSDEIIVGVCRVSIYHPKYITGYNENMILTEDQVNQFIDILNESFFEDIDYIETMTGWQYVINSYIEEFNNLNIDYHVPRNLKMPDYKNLLKEN